MKKTKETILCPSSIFGLLFYVPTFPIPRNWKWRKRKIFHFVFIKFVSSEINIFLGHINILAVFTLHKFFLTRHLATSYKIKTVQLRLFL